MTRFFVQSRLIVPVTMVAVLALGLFAPVAAQDGERISRFGEYSGYSEEIYDGYVRLSQYIEMRDGTRIAADIFRPTLNGEIVNDPVPVIFTQHRYQRAKLHEDGTIQTLLDDVPELARLIRHGYVIVATDVRGGGASFGVRYGEFTREEAYDAYDLTEWFAAQPWCNGNVGMFGISYLGITQYMAASTQPPHLKAIFPQMAMFDIYSFAYPGGVFNEQFVLEWGRNTLALDKLIPAAPVDDDPGGELRNAAMREHAGNWNIYPMVQGAPYRDSLAGPENGPVYVERSPSTYVDAINDSGVAVYHLGGWYDLYPRAALTWFNNLTVPQKIVMTPWSHDGVGGFDLLAEHLRWFDYWLKGIDNGIMDEPPIVYDVMTGPGQYDWRTADEWPLPETQYTPFYLQAGPSGSAESVNDGGLSLDTPSGDTDQENYDAYTVDYTTTTGEGNRWDNGRGVRFHNYPAMADLDEKALTYTSAPLDADTQITGHPVVHLWVSSSADDGDFFVYLEEVAPSGYSRYITEGTLRASHRALHDAPYNYVGLPYHRSFEADLVPLPSDGTPVELVFDLQPTSNVFDAGHRIRITITGADDENFQTPRLDPPPTVRVYRSANYPSHIVLPVIPAEGN
ncbi:MAG: CocE/NonD family hydrolase [Anaerolineae bacterium]|nr:CocE/NonD family hydrolase [Anaerolineae bacterium]